MVALIARLVFIFNTLFLLLLGGTGIRADEFPLKQVKLFTWVVDYEPFRSPDGKQIVLISSRHGGMKVHVMDASRSNNGSECGKLLSAKQRMIRRRGRPTEGRSLLSRRVKECSRFL